MLQHEKEQSRTTVRPSWWKSPCRRAHPRGTPRDRPTSRNRPMEGPQESGEGIRADEPVNKRRNQSTMSTQPATIPRKDDEVTQAQLRMLYQYEQAAIDAWDRYESFRNNILLRLKASIGQQPGKRRLRRKYWQRRVVAWKQKFVDENGKDKAAKILENTQPRRYLGFKWETAGMVNVGRNE